MPKLRQAASTDAARWIIERTKGFAENVGSLVPHGFEAYARVLHPARFGGSDGHPVTWSEIAASTGRAIHSEVQWPHVAFTREITDLNQLQWPPPGAPWDVAPEEGSLDVAVAEGLVEILRRHTRTPHQCWFAVWEGWSGMRGEVYTAPAFKLPNRRYYLFEDPIEAGVESFNPKPRHHRSAALWWPADEAWCVATEVDLESTYIGGSSRCITAITDDERLETISVDVATGITWDSDTVNPNPLRLDR